MYYQLTEEIKKEIDELQSIIHNQKIQIDELKEKLAGRELVQYDKYGFQFTKKVIYYISQGIEECRAIALAWDDFPQLRMSEAKMIWRVARPTKSGLKLYARAYCVQKMKKAGFKRSEIACTLGVSITTVTKIINSGCIIE